MPSPAMRCDARCRPIRLDSDFADLLAHSSTRPTHSSLTHSRTHSFSLVLSPDRRLRLLFACRLRIIAVCLMTLPTTTTTTATAMPLLDAARSIVATLHESRARLWERERERERRSPLLTMPPSCSRSKQIRSLGPSSPQRQPSAPS